MSVAGKPALHYEFGAFELDVRSGELRKHGIRIKLQDQPRQILLLLLEHPGEVVTREQLQAHLWPDSTFVDFDNAINSAVRKLRDALSDTAENPRFVETLSRRGYRFMVPVTTGTKPKPESELTQPAATSRPQTQSMVVAVIIVTGLGTVLATWLLQKSGHIDSAELRVTSLTANSGVEIQPSFSPDGTRVAYCGGGEDGSNLAIYVKLIGSGDPVQLTKGPGRDLSPAWSPDGRWIAAIRDLGRENAVLRIPASGGQPRVLARVSKAPPDEVGCISYPIGASCGTQFGGSILTWSPDGRFLFTSGKAGPESVLSLIRITVETGEQQSVTSPPKGLLGDVAPAISHDGRALAFVRLGALQSGDIYVVSLSDGGQPVGEPRRLTSDRADLSAPVWMPDGRDLIFSSDREGRRELWRLSGSVAARPTRLAAAGDNPLDVAISPQARRLVYGRANTFGSLWKVPIGTGTSGEPVSVTATKASVSHPHYSPDGKRIAFQAGRSGVDEIWLCDADGSNSVQLTTFGKGMSGSPRWSPDGRTIAFDSNVTGNWQIYVIGSEGGRPVRLSTNPAQDSSPNWSRDGHWIYFSSLRNGRWEIRKIYPDGTGETQVAATQGRLPTESTDGKYLYYRNSTADTADLCRVPLGGGPQTTVVAGVTGNVFTVVENGIYFSAGKSPMELRFFDFANNSIRVVAPLVDAGPWVTVSNDGRSALFVRNSMSAANLMLVENFR